MEISRFHDVIGPPALGGDVRSDWGPVESRAGLSLPADYKEFVSAYGPGSLNDQLYLFHPRAVDDENGLRLEFLWRQAAYEYEQLSLVDPELAPQPVHPTRGGLVPVARSISGNHVFLAPPDHPGGEWSVVLDLGTWVFLPMTFTDFLWAALHGELEAPILEGAPFFKTEGAMES
ncbi:SMI1/KNR4 family protein [Streptomyces sp. NPDC091377]|uniref:SMI1/KNR4 family protein n=1 Tax=unclassified Streptomyces TaxID=2593676 RepID=UPI0038298850